MEKSKVKSILPKPLPSPGAVGTSPSAPPNKRRTASYSPASDFAVSKRQRSKSSNSVPTFPDNGDGKNGHRPVTSCTFCRQHKIKCNASDNYPKPCQRCEKMNLKCEIDPKFRPQKGSQIQTLKSDVDELKLKIEMLTKNESLLTQALNQHNLNFLQQSQQQTNFSMSPQQPSSFHSTPLQRPTTMSDGVMDSPRQLQLDNPLAVPVSQQVPGGPQYLKDATQNPIQVTTQLNSLHHSSLDNSPMSHVKQEESPKIYPMISEFVLGGVHLTLEKANELHERFITKHLPFLPIFVSNSATELYHKSQLLFWSVILTASLSEPEPSLYMSLAALIKQLAIETCWIHTPRSTHVIQALIVLSIWPLPNEKVLDDCSYRFIGLAKKLSLQLGLHRGGKFISEFSRTQVSLGPDAECWRTRSWLAVFFCEQFWSSVLGLPPSINSTDYLLENARVDTTLPNNFRCLISLSIFQCKLVNVMGVSVTSPDGLLEPSNRAGSLNILDRELERLRFKLPIEDGSSIEVYFLYVKLMICCFSFLPGTPIEDQVKYVSSAYLAATRIITITSQMISNNTILLIELPIYVRHAITYSVLLLFKLQLSRYLIDKYVDSARQSIVTVHRLLRNTTTSWKDLQNDISRSARLLENLNIVLYTYPEIFLSTSNSETDGAGCSIISRMRSHLTASLFYDLVWCVHEARRRSLLNKNTAQEEKIKKLTLSEEEQLDYRKPVPLPFYNQITKDDFKTITTTTPNGTTITTLVPTDHALNQARSNANATGSKEPLSINGIPLTMLDATGSMNDTDSKNNKNTTTNNSSDNGEKISNNNNYNKSNDINHASKFTNANNNNKLQNNGTNSIFPNSNQLNNFMDLPIQSQASPQQFHPTTTFVNNSPMLMSDTTVSINQNPGTTPFNSANSPAIGDIPFNDDVAANVRSTEVADHMANFLQQQSNGWLNNENYEDDDFLGWFDINILPRNE
ncbi:transcriptional regulatory protein Sef1p [[Candida] anglica]|uniref:Transcriptional regulatory protein Sef1p n=1 Tax=[Candida] anglica TaxID=148631 RepID=A0ABP0EJ32_9ASCO